FSVGSAAALRAAAGAPRVCALIAVGLPLATDSGAGLLPPGVPALFVTGERDTYGPPALVSEFLRGSGELAVVPAADHFFEGKLDELEAVISEFLARLGNPRGAR